MSTKEKPEKPEPGAEAENGASPEEETPPEQAEPPEAEPTAEAAEAEAEGAEAEEAPAEEKKPEDEIAELKDRLLRALADNENTIRRARREREETAKFATAHMARDILTVSDNLRRALEAAGP